MRERLLVFLCAGTFAAVSSAAGNAISTYDAAMSVTGVTDTNGVVWIDGRQLPLEGKAFTDVDHYYDRLTSNLTERVNAGVREMRHHTSGMLFRFRTDTRKLRVRWVSYSDWWYEDNMAGTGMSGIDIYRRDPVLGWRYAKTGRIGSPKGASVELDWVPGEECIVNLPLYNGVREIAVGLDRGASVFPPAPHRGASKPIVFYGTSVTHGGCASRPGNAFVNAVGRRLDVEVVNLGFSGSGRGELEMSDKVAEVDASCYVIDCLGNMKYRKTPDFSDVKNPEDPLCVVRQRYEPFVRNVRAKRPDVPIVLVEGRDVFKRGPREADLFVRTLYGRLLGEGWKKLYLLRQEDMLSGDGEGYIDDFHPNDHGLLELADAFERILRTALSGGLVRPRIFFVGAHPDDTEGFAATAFLLKEKYDLHVIDLTRGENGLGLAGRLDGTTADLRTREEERACALLDATPHFLHDVNGAAQMNRVSVDALVHLVTNLNPVAVFTHWPVDGHPDHVQATAAVGHALRIAGRKPEVYFYEVEPGETENWNPLYSVDVSETLEMKVALLRCYACQNRDDGLVKLKVEQALRRGAERLPPVKYAETFTTFDGAPLANGVLESLPQTAIMRKEIEK